MKTGRKDSKESYSTVVEEFIPNHNDSISLVLSRFQAVGVDVEATVALLGTKHFSLTNCFNFCYNSTDNIVHYILILSHKI
jgi:peroxidase